LTHEELPVGFVAGFSVDAMEHRRVGVTEELGDDGVGDAALDEPGRERSTQIVPGHAGGLDSTTS
jgi:hypothetical protein